MGSIGKVLAASPIPSSRNPADLAANSAKSGNPAKLFCLSCSHWRAAKREVSSWSRVTSPRATSQPRSIRSSAIWATRPASGPARRHRLGQDVHDGQRDRAREPAHARDGARTRRLPRSSTTSSRACSRKTQSATSSPTTTTISPKRTFPRPTRLSRRTRASTTRSTSCAIRPPRRCSSATTC